MALSNSASRAEALAKAETEKLSDLFPAKGERALSIGQTGSGKTTFNRWLLERLPETPVVIYDTKHDGKFDELEKTRVVESIEGAEEAMADLECDYVIFRPPPVITSNPVSLDKLLQYHEENWRGIDAYIDEVYHFHRGAYAGPGLNGLYTRGRSRGITTIASSQRPSSVSKFLFSETQIFYVFALYLDDDLKRIAGFIPGFDKLPRAPKHKFYVYRQGQEDEPKLMGPVPVSDSESLGYTDHESSAETAEIPPDDDPDAQPKGRHLWL